MLTAQEARKMSNMGTHIPIASEVEKALNGVFGKIIAAAESGKTFISYDFYSDRLTLDQRIEAIVYLQNMGYDVHKLDYPTQIWLQW